MTGSGGHPVITNNSAMTGSSAFADDESGACC
jgi:hypothetical protein